MKGNLKQRKITKMVACHKIYMGENMIMLTFKLHNKQMRLFVRFDAFPFKLGKSADLADEGNYENRQFRK